MHEKLALEFHEQKMKYLKEEHDMKMRNLQVELDMKLEERAVQRTMHEQCCQIGRFSAQLGYFCLRQAGKKYIGRVNTIWAAFVHIWRVFNIVKTALSLF